MIPTFFRSWRIKLTNFTPWSVAEVWHTLCTASPNLILSQLCSQKLSRHKIFVHYESHRMYGYTDVQFNPMWIYLNLLINIAAKEKGTMLHLMKADNTELHIILVERDFWFNPTYTSSKTYELLHKTVLLLLKWSYNFRYCLTMLKNSKLPRDLLNARGQDDKEDLKATEPV